MYLVTGGAGFIGSNLVASLAARGARVVVNDTFAADDKWKNLVKHNVYDFVTPAQLDSWLAANADRLTAIVHMGAVTATTERNSDLILAVNFQLSTRLWEWCSHHQVAFIYASSAATYGDGAQGFDDDFGANALANFRPLNPYAWSKLAFDRRVLCAVSRGEPTPPKWAGLKFFNVYGPNEYHKGSMQSVIALNYDRIKSGEPLRLFRSYRRDYPDGGQMRDFIYVKDCVSVILWMLDNCFSPSIYNVGSGLACRWLDLSRAMFKAACVPERIAFIEMPEILRAQYQYYTRARIDKLRAAGYAGQMYTLEDGVADYIKSYLSREDRFA